MQSFRRGIDRRAYVLARAQCGDIELVRKALIGVNQAFNQEAKDLPIAQWPIRFWTILLSRKELTQGSSPWQALASISHGSRAALLLRLVGGLDFPHAAKVLGISEDTYRFALQRGLEQLQSAGYSMAELEQLRDAFFDEVKQLSPEELAASFQGAQQETDVTRSAAEKTEHDTGLENLVFTSKQKTPKKTSRRWLWWLLGVLLLGLIAVGAIFLQQKQQHEKMLQQQQQATEADRQAGDLLMHADYEVIAAGEAWNDAQEANFYSWLAADTPPESLIDAETKTSVDAQGLPIDATPERPTSNENADQE